MKRSTYFVAGSLGIAGIGILWLVSSDTLAPGSASPLQQKTRIEASNSIQNRDDELLVRNEPAVDLVALGIDPLPFKSETEDSALIRILTHYQPPSVGTVKSIASETEVLELPDGRRFEAVTIGKTRSQANDGTIALAAHTLKTGRQLKITEGDVVMGNPSEVWILKKDGEAERVSTPLMHAEHPIISPDGRYVAFGARYLVGERLHPKVLMIVDRANGTLSSYAERKHGSDYEISPIDWVEGGKVLRVVEDWGETGGHVKLKQVRVQ